MLSSPHFWVIPQNISKNNKNKIKGVGVGRKINVEILNVFGSPVVLLVLPKNEGKCKFEAKIIYYWINLHKS